jgi:type II secretion system protein H
MTRRHYGFTLIEILIVLLIVSIIATVATLTMRKDDALQAKLVAQELVKLFPVVQQQAILQPATYGFYYTTDGYEFLQYRTNKVTQQGLWLPIVDDRILGFHHLPKGVRIHLNIIEENLNTGTENNDEDNDNNSAGNSNDSDNGDDESNTNNEIANDNSDAGKTPTLIFDTNGEFTPFELSVTALDGSVEYHIFGYADGSIVLTK